MVFTPRTEIEDIGEHISVRTRVFHNECPECGVAIIVRYPILPNEELVP
jgi:predicted RNA-binding Zn-ribbon protein involved in translation (DUF1610 family)